MHFHCVTPHTTCDKAPNAVICTALNLCERVGQGCRSIMMVLGTHFEHELSTVDVCDGGPLDGEALGALAVPAQDVTKIQWGKVRHVQSGSSRHGGGAQGSCDFGTVSRLADFCWCGAAVVCGVHVNAQLREETAHGNVAIEYTARKSHILALDNRH